MTTKTARLTLQEEIEMSLPRILSLMFAILVLLTTPAANQAAEWRAEIAAGTRLIVRSDENITTRDCYQGQLVDGTLLQDVLSSEGSVALPAGTRVRLSVAECKRAGRVHGRAVLRVRLYSITDAAGKEVPLSGFVASAEGVKHVDREGSIHGNPNHGTDAAVTVPAVVIGAGTGFEVAGPLGGAAGLGAGLIVAGVWAFAHRGPDFSSAKGSEMQFTTARPITVAVASDEVRPVQAPVHGSVWGQGMISSPPSADLLAMVDSVNTDPHGVLNQIKKMKFKNRNSSDQCFAKYLQSLCLYNEGEKQKALDLVRQAFQEARSLNFPASARAEIARNLIRILSDTKADWMRDPVLGDPEVQRALVTQAHAGGSL